MARCEGSGLRAGLFFYRIGISLVNANKYERNNFKAFLICSAYSARIPGVLTATICSAYSARIPGVLTATLGAHGGAVGYL